jgi:hypothetical protein
MSKLSITAFIISATVGKCNPQSTIINLKEDVMAGG